MIKEKKDLISIIGQVYNEEIMLPIYYEEFDKFTKKMSNVDFELIFIDDSSKDKSIDIIKDIAKKDAERRIKQHLSEKNF